MSRALGGDSNLPTILPTTIPAAPPAAAGRVRGGPTGTAPPTRTAPGRPAAAGHPTVALTDVPTLRRVLQGLRELPDRPAAPSR